MDDKALSQYKSKRHLALRPKHIIEWVQGEPIVRTEFVVPKHQMESVFLAALSLPYEGLPDPANQGDILPEPEFEGMTNLEVGTIKAARKFAQGDLEAIKTLSDRLLGKPKQAIEQVSVEMTLKEYLDNIGPDMEVKFKEWEDKTIDVQAEKSWDDII